ncbi:unnamed protein product [Parnassius apollo]|uniref:(apollo) hypothetical protein n=1 Tax=Parnassius apollo TaxID=110799 RepID=A0A8S3WZG5_PARAO|nr:unnamed protein product [Parnassius apollo]
MESVSVMEDMNISQPKKLFSILCKAVLAEFISTLLLVLLGCMCCVPISSLTHLPLLYGPLGFGLVVLINIQAFGHISGAHMNPAVTLAALLWGKMSIATGIAYILAQCAGSIAGYGILVAVSPIDLTTDGICTTQPHVQLTTLQALGIEVILTATLNFINCAVWDQVNEAFLESVSLKIGFTIAGLSIAGGPFTGGSMNPARSLGPALWTSTWNAHWVYWIGPLLGGSLSAIFYKCTWLKKGSNYI